MPRGESGPGRRVGPGPLLAWAALALALAIPATARAGPDKAPLVYTKTRAFRIPFNIEVADRPRISEVQLYVSDDMGLDWTPVGTAGPSEPSIPYRAPRDGEFWFAVRTKDNRGRMYPPSDVPVEPSLRVVVDTVAPSVVVEPAGRRGGQASIRYEVMDANLDLSSLVVEYQAEGSTGGWRRAPAKKALLAAVTWDAGTAEALTVRVSVEDKAHNRREAEVQLPDGSAATPALADAGAFEPTPLSPLSGRPADRSRAGGGTRPVANSTPRSGGVNPDDLGDPFSEPPPIGDQAEPAPAPIDPGPLAQQAAPDPTGAGAGATEPILVGSPRFPLQYAVDDAGPEGPAVVELFVTRDGGTTWLPLGQDPDLRSPFVVDLVGEGAFGLYLAARSAGGLGDPPPAPGTPPQSVVIVDASGPSVQLDPPQLGNGPIAGKLVITWRVSDPHPADRPIVLSYRPDSPGAIWQQFTGPIANTGRFAWTLPANAPPRFFVRLDAFDSLGNRSSAESAEPVVVDLARPKGRILGLDPSARAGGGQRR